MKQYASSILVVMVVTLGYCRLHAALPPIVPIDNYRTPGIVDVALSTVFDDPSSTPQERAQALNALVNELVNVPSDVKGFALDAFFEKAFGGSGGKMQIGQQTLKDYLDSLISKLIPERSRPTHEERLDAMLQSLKDKYGDAIPADQLKDITSATLTIQ